jgi:hypothetical protein
MFTRPYGRDLPAITGGQDHQGKQRRSIPTGSSQAPSAVRLLWHRSFDHHVPCSPPWTTPPHLEGFQKHDLVRPIYVCSVHQYVPWDVCTDISVER